MKIGAFLAVFLLVLTGCGGGGGHKDKMPSTLEGVANIHEDTTAPRIGIVERYSGTFRSVGKAVRLSRVPRGQGWVDVNWNGLELPSDPYKEYFIVAFNDLNDDGMYQTSELLGFFPGSLISDSGTWWITETYYGYEKKALDCRGKDIYIDADYQKVIVIYNDEKAFAKTLK